MLDVTERSVPDSGYKLILFLPPAHEVRGKVIRILGNVCLFTTRGVGGYPGQVPDGGRYPILPDGRGRYPILSDGGYPILPDGVPPTFLLEGGILILPDRGTLILPDRGCTPSFLTSGEPQLTDMGGTNIWLADGGYPGAGTGWSTPPRQDWMGIPPHQDSMGYLPPPPPPIRTGWQLNTLCRRRHACCGIPQEDFLVLFLLINSERVSPLGTIQMSRWRKREGLML